MSDWIKSESVFESASISEPPKWQCRVAPTPQEKELWSKCGSLENPNMVAAELIARHLAELTAAVEKLTEAIEKQEKRSQ